MYAGKTYKGRFSPKNPGKYQGDSTNIIFRSLWERKVMKYFDENPAIIAWQSEELAIPYHDPVQNKVRRYFPDFLIKAKQNDGSIKMILIEVKPKVQATEPKSQKRKTRKYITEVATWSTNTAKWKAAEEYCSDRGWIFKILTEEQIFGPKNKKVK